MASQSLGNPLDIPARSLVALREADLLVFEEDRPARQALKAAGITRTYVKLTEHNESVAIDEIRAAFKAGKTVCYMSDQGCPTVDDPGAQILQIAEQFGVRVSVIPGPSSITAALSALPVPFKTFYYAGFLPRDAGPREAELRRLATFKEPVVILDTPYRRAALIDSCLRVFGASRRALLASDISGENESFKFAPLQEIKARADTLSDKLNFVLVIV